MLIPILGVFVAGIVGLVYWLITEKAPPADHAPSFAVKHPLPESKMKEAILRFRSTPLRDQGILEKVVLIALLGLNFSQILPGTALTTLQLVVGIVLVVILNAVISELLARRGLVLINEVRHFGAMVVINMFLAAVFLTVLPGRQESIRINNMIFYFFLVSLLVTLFDRFRVVAMVRNETRTPGKPS